MLAIYLREVKRLLKQPKSIFTTFIMPGALILFLMWIFMTDTLSRDSQAMVILTDEAEYVETFLEKNPIYEDIRVYEGETEAVKEAYENGQIGVVLELELAANSAQIRFDDTKLREAGNYQLAQRLVRELAMYRNSEELYLNYVKVYPEITALDVATDKQLWVQQISSLLGIFSMIFIFLVGVPMVSHAVDVYVGERERGSYDSIRLAGINISTFLLGKILYITTIGMLSGAIQITCAIIGANRFMPDFKLFSFVEQPAALWGTLVITAAVSLMILVSATVYMSTFFETSKDAGTYVSLGTIAFTALTQANVVFDSDLWAYIPFANMSGLLQDAAFGNMDVMKLIISTVVGLGVVAVFIFLSMKQLEHKEK